MIMNSIQANERHMNIKQHFEVENIPVSMREYEQWVCWKYHNDGVPGQDRRRKVPVNPKTERFAKVTDETTWTSLDKALRFASQPNQHMDGIGFVFTENDPFVGVDLDDCRNELTGRLDPWAQEVVSKLGSYSEVSPSRTGVKVFAKTDSLFPSRRRSKPGLEVYRSARFFTVTGQILGMHSETNDGTDAIQWIQDRYFPDVVPESSDQCSEPTAMMASDEQVVTKATTARNGPKFRQLWEGSMELNNGNQSEADLSLCRLLAFWCGPCHEQIDRLFRKSGLFRSKWDERHFTSGATYGIETIRKSVLAQGDIFYRWPSQRYENKPIPVIQPLNRQKRQTNDPSENRNRQSNALRNQDQVSSRRDTGGTIQASKDPGTSIRDDLDGIHLQRSKSGNRTSCITQGAASSVGDTGFTVHHGYEIDWEDLTNPVQERASYFVAQNPSAIIFLNPLCTILDASPSEEFFTAVKKWQANWCKQASGTMGRHSRRKVADFYSDQGRMSKKHRFFERAFSFTGIMFYDGEVIQPHRWEDLKLSQH